MKKIILISVSIVLLFKTSHAQRNNIVQPVLTSLSPLSAKMLYPLKKNSDEDKKSRFKLGGNLYYSLLYEPDKYSVSNIPQSVRLVPVHKDDANIFISNGPINDGRFHSNDWKYLEFGASAQIKYQIKSFKAEIGGRITYNFNNNQRLDTVERNYTNSPGTPTRGEGAALTYYTVYPGGFEYGPYAKFSLSIFSLEYYFNFSSVIAETGWDRYDAYAKYKTYTLFNLDSNIIKAALNFSHLSFYAGYTVNSLTTNLIDKNMIINHPNHAVCGMEISVY